MHPRLLGIGTALPDGHVPQEDALRLAASRGQWPEDVASKLAAVYRRTSVASRSSVLLTPDTRNPAESTFFPPASDSQPLGPTTAARFAAFDLHAPALGLNAAHAALADANVAPNAITHLVAVSCTGVSAPGLDVSLAQLLGLRHDVERTFVAFMGCAGAISGLGVARNIAASNPDALVLVVSVELCSLHMQYSAEVEQVIANALFADGAAAAVVGTKSTPNAPTPAIVSRLCSLIPGTTDLMTWRLGDHGLRMTLSPRIPETIAAGLRPRLTEWLGTHNRRLADIASWAVHPGGPRVLDAVAAALDLPTAALDASRAVLRDHGNMSSATLGFIHNHLRNQRKQGASSAPCDQSLALPCVWLGFSPGLTIEALLLA